MIGIENSMPFPNQKLVELINSQTNGNIQRFANMIGMSQQRVNRLIVIDKRNGKYPRITDDLKLAINKVFNLPANYFYQSIEEERAGLSTMKPSYGNGKPYYNVDFEMGYDLMVNDQTTNADYMIDFEPYNKCDCWCNARGNSMFPTISNGDVIAIKEIKDPSCLISGEIYAIVTTNELRTIKRIKDNGDTITLIPDNKEYPEQTIDKDMILKVFRVLGSMKVF